MIIPDDFAQVNIIYGGGALVRGAQVTFGVDRSVDLPTPAAIAGMVKARYEADIQPQANSQSIVVEYLVKSGPNDTGPQASLSAFDGGGGVLGDTYPNVALLVRKQTALGGRHGRGRMYWPILGEASIDGGGNLTVAALGIYQTAMNEFLADLATDGIPMVLLHADALTPPTPVETLSVQSLIATQRRRLRK